MSGKSFSWVIAEEFKNKFTPDQLDAGIAQKNTSADIAFSRSGNSRAMAGRVQITWSLARDLQARNIALQRPIALGLSRRFGCLREACLAVEIIPGAIPLKGYIDRYGPRPGGLLLPDGRDLIDLFIDFSSRLRKTCILPPDFHLGDVLIRAAADGSPALYLADAARLTPKRSTSGRTRVDSLLMLDAVLWGKAPSRQQLFFARLYLYRMSQWLQSFHRRAGDLVQELRFFSSCPPDGQITCCFRTGALQGCVQSGQYENTLLKLLENPAALFSRSDAAVLKNSPTTTALLLQIPELPFPIFVKRYNSKGRLFGLKYLLRRSRARRAWCLARQLEGLPVPTPEVLGFVEQRRFGFLQAAYLITCGLVHTEILDVYIEKHFAQWNMKTKNLFIQQVAAMLRDAHGRGLLHGDLKAKNILVASDGETEKLWLIDLDAARLRKQPGLAECCDDLARLNCSFLNTARISRPQRLLFLKTYVQDKQPALREAWQTILKLSSRKLRKSGRSFSR